MPAGMAALARSGTPRTVLAAAQARAVAAPPAPVAAVWLEPAALADSMAAAAGLGAMPKLERAPARAVLARRASS